MTRDLDALSREKRIQLERLLLARAGRGAAIPRRPAGEPAPLSPAQRRLWFFDQLAPGSPAYNAVVAVRARGRLDLDVLRRALLLIIARHEVLRSAILGQDGVGYQEPLADWQLRFEVTDAASESAAHRILAAFAREPYDLAHDVPLRVCAVRLGPDDALIGFGEHHIAFDAWSDGVLFAELSEAYAALLAGTGWHPEPLAVQYGDVAAWLAQRARDPALAAYWRDQLDGAPAAVDLPIDHDYPDVAGYDGAHLPLRVEGALAELAALREQEGVTSFVVLSAALAAGVFRWSGAADLVIGTPFANRGRAEFEGLIGFFANTVPLRFRMSPAMSFRALVAQTREVVLGAFAHQELPFEHIVELTRQGRDSRRNPLFQVNLRVQQGDPALPAVAGVSFEPVALDMGFSRFELAADLTVLDSGIEGYLEYNFDLFDESTAQRLAGWLSTFVADCLRRPDTSIGALEFGPGSGSVRGRRRNVVVA